AEAQGRPVDEDATDVLAHGGRALDALARSPVVKDDVVVVHRRDRIEVLAVPRVVVRVDQRAQVHQRPRLSHEARPSRTQPLWPPRPIAFESATSTRTAR